MPDTMSKKLFPHVVRKILEDAEMQAGEKLPFSERIGEKCCTTSGLDDGDRSPAPDAEPGSTRRLRRRQLMPYWG